MEKCNYLVYGAIFPENSAKSVVVERLSETEVNATEIPLSEFTRMRDKGKLELSLEFPNGNIEAELVSSGAFADPRDCNPDKLCCLETSEAGGHMPLVFGEPRVFIGVSLIYHPEAGLAFGGDCVKAIRNIAAVPLDRQKLAAGIRKLTGYEVLGEKLEFYSIRKD